MLYELLTGQLPFRAETPLATLKLVTDAEPPKPRALNPALDRDLETICQKCLEKDPAHRYPSADALAEDLERWRANKPITARRTSLPERAWKWVKREPLKAALAVLIVLAVLGPWLVARAYLREFPHMATEHPVTTPDHADIYSLPLHGDLNGDRCTENFWRGPFAETNRLVRLEFANVPPALLAGLPCLIRADIAGRPDPARSPELTNGQTFRLQVESKLDRNFYVASVGWTASNAMIRLTIIPEENREWRHKKP
jgi:hypothetical protein